MIAPVAPQTTNMPQARGASARSNARAPSPISQAIQTHSLDKRGVRNWMGWGWRWLVYAFSIVAISLEPTADGTRQSSGPSLLLTQPQVPSREWISPCLLYTSDAADDLLCVDLGGRRII